MRQMPAEAQLPISLPFAWEPSDLSFAHLLNSAEGQAQIACAAAQLPPHLRWLVEARWGAPPETRLTLEQIADELGTTRSHARLREREALWRLSILFDEEISETTVL